MSNNSNNDNLFSTNNIMNVVKKTSGLVSKTINYYYSDDNNSENDQEYDAEHAQKQIEYLKSKDTLVWSEIQEVILSTPGKGQPLYTRTFLVLAYTNGFQVYEVSAETKPILVDVVSRKDATVKFAKVLSQPSLSPDDKTIEADEKTYSEDYPLLAIVYKEDPNTVKFFSLRTFKFVHELRFETEVQQIASNPHMLTITDHEHITWINPLTMGIMVYFNAYPVPQELDVDTNGAEQKSQLGAIALGPRWVAYPSALVVQNKHYDYTLKSNSTLSEISVDYAKKLGSTAMFLGDLGFKAVSSVISDGQQQQEPVAVQKPYGKDTGNVEIRDNKTKKSIAHFRAHTEPIAAMAFDPSGTLLVTASVKGTVLHVFQIMPNQNGTVGSKNIKLIYRLHRGYTPARIHAIRFSINSKWIAVSSLHGTTHLYAINPTGGVVDPEDFVSLYDSNIRDVHPPEGEVTEAINLYASNRVEGITAMFYDGPTVETTPQQSYPVEKKPSEILLSSTITGQFRIYRLEPTSKVKEPSEVSKMMAHVTQQGKRTNLEYELSLAIKTTQRHEACRAENQTARETQLNWVQPTSIYPSAIGEEQKSRWISHAEIESYQVPSLPIWTTGQFKFKTYGEEPTNKIYPKLPKPKVVKFPSHSEDDMAKSVFIRVGDPIPVRNTLEREVEEHTGLSPPIRDNGILKAMSTPMRGKQGKGDWDMVEDIVPNVQSKQLSNHVVEDSDDEEEKVVPQKIFINDNQFISSPVSPVKPPVRETFDIVEQPKVEPIVAPKVVTKIEPKVEPPPQPQEKPKVEPTQPQEIKIEKKVENPLIPKKELIVEKVSEPPRRSAFLSQAIDSDSDSEVDDKPKEEPKPQPPKEEKKSSMGLSAFLGNVKDDYLKDIDESVMNESYLDKLDMATNAVHAVLKPESPPPTQVEPPKWEKPQSMAASILNSAPIRPIGSIVSSPVIIEPPKPVEDPKPVTVAMTKTEKKKKKKEKKKNKGNNPLLQNSNTSISSMTSSINYNYMDQSEEPKLKSPEEEDDVDDEIKQRRANVNLRESIFFQQDHRPSDTESDRSDSDTMM